MQHTDSVPANVASLARSHSSTSLLFMEWVGFVEGRAGVHLVLLLCGVGLSCGANMGVDEEGAQGNGDKVNAHIATRVHGFRAPGFLHNINCLLRAPAGPARAERSALVPLRCAASLDSQA